MFEAIKKLLELLPRQTKVRFALLLIPMLTVSVMEMLSIALIVPVAYVVLEHRPADEIFGSIGALSFLVGPDPRSIVAIFIALFCVKSVSVFGTSYLVARTVQINSAHFLSSLYEFYLRHPLVFHYRHNSAELLRNITSGTWQTFHGVQIVMNTVLELLLALAVSTTLLVVSPWVTIGIAVVLAAVGGLAYRAAAPVIGRWGQIAMSTEGDIIKWTVQSLAGLRDIKLSRSYSRMSGAINQMALRLAVYNARAQTALQSPRLLVEIVAVVGCLSVVLIVSETALDTERVVPLLGLFSLAAMRLIPSASRILSNVADLRHRTSYITQLHHDVTTRDMDFDSGGRPIERRPGPAFSRDVTLSDVSYRYEDRDEDAIANISCTIRRGESIGIAGTSGAGKSTLVDIILGFLRPTSGDICVDGRDIWADLASWQSRIGYVPQQVNLFDDTLRRNIAFAVPDAEIDDVRVSEVIKVASLDDLVAHLPKGIDSVVGERGTRLSGGQRQRIAIARALYHDPDLIVFDEATAALDNETEREITEAINRLAGRKTIIIIAHRLSTIINCDRILFMEHGQLAGVGSFRELERLSDRFRDFIRFGLGHEQAATNASA